MPARALLGEIEKKVSKIDGTPCAGKPARTV